MRGEHDKEKDIREWRRCAAEVTDCPSWRSGVTGVKLGRGSHHSQPWRAGCVERVWDEFSVL